MDKLQWKEPTISTAIGREVRENGMVISTIKANALDWYGNYETAVSFCSGRVWNIAEGYETEEEARAGHQKYANMTTKELRNLEYIG